MKEPCTVMLEVRNRTPDHSRALLIGALRCPGVCLHGRLANYNVGGLFGNSTVISRPTMRWNSCNAYTVSKRNTRRAQGTSLPLDAHVTAQPDAVSTPRAYFNPPSIRPHSLNFLPPQRPHTSLHSPSHHTQHASSRIRHLSHPRTSKHIHATLAVSILTSRHRLLFSSHQLPSFSSADAAVISSSTLP